MPTYQIIHYHPNLPLLRFMEDTENEKVALERFDEVFKAGDNVEMYDITNGLNDPPLIKKRKQNTL